VKTGLLLRDGDEIALAEPEPEPAGPRPEPIDIRLLHQDPDFVVIDKPAGLVVHAGAGVRSGTLVNALLYRLGQLEGGESGRPGIVHRLDKGTSGVMVAARNERSHRALAEQFKSRQVRKEYLALVHGNPRRPEDTIRAPVGRDPRHRTRMSVRPRRSREAVTHYRVERQYGPFSLLRVRIETGRTHQIRVHLAHVGHPVVGDSTYGGQRARALPATLARRVVALDRVFLHAWRLEFRHPLSGESLRFESPLPEKLRAFLDAL
jgi:23S rRNA pseudouridine1911/1915/1917 synthase